jgi:hypothetical protein
VSFRASRLGSTRLGSERFGLPPILVTAAALVVAAPAVVVSGCRDSGDSGEPKVVLTTADVQDAFAHQGLDLASYEIGPGIPALVYPTGALEGDAEYLVVCEIYDFPVMARSVVTTIRKKRPGNVSQALRAKNVVVLIDPAATPGEVRRTLRAVVELRHE